MIKKIYGVDLSQPITPIQVREAIIECFKQAHGDVLAEIKDFAAFSNDEEFEEMKKLDVKYQITKAFNETGGNFDKPTKASILLVLDWLKRFSEKFRTPEIINKHYTEILKLTELL